VAGKKSRKQKSASRNVKKKSAPSSIPSKPNTPHLANLLEQGLGHHRQHNLTGAADCYRAILATDPTHSDALHLLGLTYAQQELHHEAIELYKQALAQTPIFAGAYNNLGISYNTIGEFALAIDSFKKSLKIEANSPDTHNNLGNAFSKIDKREEAIKHFKKAIQINPNHTDAYYNLGNTLNKLYRHEEAIDNFNHALKLNPKHKNAYSNLGFTLRSICDWSEYNTFACEMIKRAQSTTTTLKPFYFLAWSDSPEDQLLCAKHYTEATFPSSLPQLNPKPPLKDGRIRIGYLSTDFRDHVVSQHTIELFERHNRDNFEIFGFALGTKDSSPMRIRLNSAFDHFIEVGHLGDSQVAALIAKQGIHILVDLTGYSMGARTRILAMRPAPMQVSYLGYIGTMGADFIDYILVDKHCAPDTLQPHFREKLVHLSCYMVNDRKRTVAEQTPTRAEVNLPEEGFIFSSFNNSYKITPQVFDIWMRCLLAVPNSVLWLMSESSIVQENLRKEAKARGVSPKRLIFAPRIEASQHLARQRLADLFLDTLPVNAGATACDALWVGLPLLTCQGKSFVARMGGSLVYAAGLPELVVDSLEEYESLAIELATQPNKLRALRERLRNSRDTALLFDSQQFCENLEKEFSTMWGKWNDEIITSNLQENTPIESNKKISNKHSNADIDKLFEKAISLHHQKNLKDARKAYQKVLAQDKTHAGALHYLGIIRAQQGHPEEAIKLYQKSLSTSSEVSEVHNNLGVALNTLQKHTEALAAFQNAVDCDPKNAEAYNNLGGLLGYFEQKEKAKECFSKALEIMPQHDEAHYNLAVLLSDQEQFDEAEKHYKLTIKINPNHFGALNNLGIIYMQRKEYHDACAKFRQALRIEPSHANTLSQLSICLRQLCDWKDFDKTKNSLIRWQKAGSPPPNAFSFLMWSDNPAAQQQCARAYINTRIPAELKPINATPSPNDKRIKVAYLSSDFRDHPIAHLTAELYELHDRNKFEITAIAYGTSDSSPMRQRLINAFDHFHVVGDMSDAEIAKLITSKGIHIVVDLMGHTQGAKPGVLARRPAPIQINYLGYIGTMGSNFIDYIIVDDFSVPPSLQPYFDEKLTPLPCYMVIDTQREISAETPTRPTSGLPEEGFVFCSFNNTYKITPEIFDVWMRCLKATPNSVLWLLGDNKWAQENLRKEANKRGIDPTRLVFAERTDSAKHLARQRLADLFLDTLPVNAGATASDALWIGLPVLTCAGKSFVARMGGGLVRAAGVPELITESLDDYEAVAIELAQTPAKLATIREKLIANRDTAPLFNSKEFCHNFEAALTTMWERWRDSLDKETIEQSQTIPLQTMLEKVVALHQQGNLDAAEQGYNKVLELNPQEADALHLLGVINAQRGNIDKAIELYLQSIEANPKLVNAYSNLGIALHSTNKPHEAAQRFRQAIEISPNVDAYYNLGNCLYGLQQYEEAIKNYKQALMIDPNHANAQQNMNASLKQLGR